MTAFDQLEKHNLKYIKNYHTSRISSIKCGGVASVIIYPKTADELILAIKIAAEYLGRYKIIGGCTNTFFCDEGFDGALITTKELSKTECCGTFINAEAGVPLIKALLIAAKRDIDLGCGLYGIPGTVGGAVRNNAGAFCSEISSAFSYGRFYDPQEDRLLTLDAKDLAFGYRASRLQYESLIFISGALTGKSRSSEDILKDFRCVFQKRQQMHPKEASLGSFFKRQGDIIPARLIDEIGLKGFTVGAAAVSMKHAGVIVNKGGATSHDVDTLASKIEENIYSIYGVKLLREAELVK